MADGFENWDAVTAFALTLPGAEMESFYGVPTPKVGGKAFVAVGREVGSFALMTSLEAKAMLMETQPALFWETDHYRGWPAVLVRFGVGERDWLETLIARAWWDKASPKLRRTFGLRPLSRGRASPVCACAKMVPPDLTLIASGPLNIAPLEPRPSAPYAPAMFPRLLARDLGHAWGRAGSALLPVVFFLLVAAVFPFAVGPDPKLLAKVGAGVVWMAALLAALLPIPTLFEVDRAGGTLDQYAARGIADEVVAAARLVAHGLAFGLPLLVAAPLAGLMLDLDGAGIGRLMGALALGLPGLAALAIIAAALTAGAREGGMLAGLLVLPLAAPLLIFGAGAAGGAGAGAPKLLSAVSLLLVAVAPFAAGAGLRAART